MAEALKRWNEATSTWVTVASVNRIEVSGSLDGFIKFQNENDGVEFQLIELITTPVPL